MKTNRRSVRFLCTVLISALVLSLFAVPAFAEQEEPAAVDPYAWLGLTEIPKCNYLDCLSTNHYIRTYDNYLMSFCVERTEAVDGINNFSSDSTSRAWSVDGIILSVTDSAKMYMKIDMSSAVNEQKENLEKAMTEGINLYQRTFQKTGKEAVPLYSEKGDTADYDYYEYQIAASEEELAAMGITKSLIVERYYMKDGDVFAVYKHTELGEMVTDTVDVIKSMSPEIPEGTFDLPDLTGYSEIGK